MYVRLITFHVKPDVTRVHAAAVYEALSAEMRDYRGFQGMTVLMNEGAEQAVSLTYWQDQASATEAGAKSLPVMLEKVHELVDRPPEISGYELVRQEFLPI
jgi:heme-degrading monooxygenase HmoA